MIDLLLCILHKVCATCFMATDEKQDEEGEKEEGNKLQFLMRKILLNRNTKKVVCCMGP